MPQTPEAQAFLSKISALPKDTSVSLDQVLKHSVDEETELRRLFATDPGNSRLKDPYVGLVDIFDAPQDIRTTRARAIRDDFDLAEKYIMPLSETKRRKEGTPAMVVDLEEFKSNWAIFTENALSLLDWTNVVAAGGSVLACLMPVPEHAKKSKRSLRKYFHTDTFPTSDVDLFLYGMTPEQAEAKIISIYQAVRDSIPWDCTCVRTKHSISIHSQYPYRSVQIVLRLYASPAEILAGFDIDAPCCAYDGTRPWANPRAIVAMMRQCNTIDITRRSPSYEVRLSKYSYRDFEVQVPNLRRENIDPTIFERSIARVPGLARLIVLERLYSPESREEYLNSRRNLRGRPPYYFDTRRRNRVYKGDLKAKILEETLATSSYDVLSLHIPYGPGWDARRINKLIYQTDLGMNSRFNPKNKDRRLHRHPAFFGSIEECLEDCCEFCPMAQNEEEKEIEEGEKDTYIRGRIEFIQEDPGRQSTSGSFHPIDDGEWTEQAYIGESEKLCKAIQSFDRVSVLRMINIDGMDVNRRDHVGRTPLHVAIIARASDIACDLIDAGARMTARVVDGRTALHLVAQMDLPEVARKLLQRSVINKEKAEEAKAQAAKQAATNLSTLDEDDPMDGSGDDGETSKSDDNNSSADDWSSGDQDEDNAAKENPEPKNASGDGNIPEDNDDAPDVFDLDLPDWDFGLTPLGYAVIFGSFGVVEELIVAGADPARFNRINVQSAEPVHPLTLTVETEDEDCAVRIMERLLQAGATSSTADTSLLSIFHRVVCARKPKLVSTLLRADPNAKLLVNFPVADYYQIVFPTVSAIQSGDYATLALLVAHGAKVLFNDDDLQSTREALQQQSHFLADYQKLLHSPVEVALANNDYVVHLLVTLGADVNLPTRRANSYGRGGTNCYSLLDWVGAKIRNVEKRLDNEYTEKGSASEPMEESSSSASGWKAYYHDCIRKLSKPSPALSQADRERKEKEKLGLLHEKEYLEDVKTLFVANKAKIWDEIYPDKPAVITEPGDPSVWQPMQDVRKSYMGFVSSWRSTVVAENQVDLYDELYEACWNGDSDKVQELCLPKDGSKLSHQPLQIVVTTPEGGFSPLFVAIHRRHWTVARLILTIASAQHLTQDEEQPRTRFSTANIKLEDDDSECDDSEYEDDDDDSTGRNAEVDFIDLAQRKAAARSPVGADHLLKMTAKYRDRRGAEYHVNVIDRAISDGDFKAFVRIAEMCKSLPKPISLDQVVNTIRIFLDDRVEILDEYIRRTGYGIHISAQQETDTPDGKLERPKGTEYWGLNIHGKKRKDLAFKGDPNAPSPVVDNTGPTPLVWQAALRGATEILKYLAGDRPLAAYRYYLSTSASDKLSRNVSDLDAIFPRKLGWCSSSVNETALVAAIGSKRFDSVKTLFSLRPKLMKEYLHYKITYSGFNVLLRAVVADCPLELIDYLLENGVAATHLDLRCWNVAHVACANFRKIQLEHLLKKLPKNIVEALLVQQSKPFLNTPLHVAVGSGATEMVKLLAAIKTPAFLLRDVNGLTPLHVAVKRGFSEIATILAQAGPPESLYMENAVGEIPIETVIQQDLIIRCGLAFTGKFVAPSGCQLPSHTGVVSLLRPFDIPTAENKVRALRNTTEQLVKEGRLTQGTKLLNAMTEFVDKMDGKIAEFRVKEVGLDAVREKLKDEDGVQDYARTHDKADRRKTLECIRKAMQDKPAMHRLSIHLCDVQRSVLNNLPQRDLKKKEKKDDDDLDGEADDEGLINGDRNWLGTGCDTQVDMLATGSY